MLEQVYNAQLVTVHVFSICLLICVHDIYFFPIHVLIFDIWIYWSSSAGIVSELISLIKLLMFLTNSIDVINIILHFLNDNLHYIWYILLITTSI